ncbi:MAG: hypothetical protein ACYDCC_15125 [Actinomycetota bacterium]
MTETTTLRGPTVERWQALSLIEQLGNIGSEVGRALNAKAQGATDRMQGALYRALDLFELTVDDPRWRVSLKEILRARDVVCDFIVGDNEYCSTAESIDNYFMTFAVAARNR